MVVLRGVVDIEQQPKPLGHYCYNHVTIINIINIIIISSKKKSIDWGPTRNHTCRVWWRTPPPPHSPRPPPPPLARRDVLNEPRSSKVSCFCFISDLTG